METVKLTGNMQAMNLKKDRSAKTKVSQSVKKQLHKIEVFKRTDHTNSGQLIPNDKRIEIARIQNKHTEHNQTAKAIRASDELLKVAESHVEKMKVDLERITKIFPPFPPGSEERVRLLKRFNSFRQLIEQLTIPPNEENAEITKPDPVQFRIPAIHEGATDEEIRATIKHLDHAEKRIDEMRKNLSNEAAKAHGLFQPSEIENPDKYESYGETLKSAEMENEANVKSQSLTHSLRNESSITLTEDPSQFIAFLI